MWIVVLFLWKLLTLWNIMELKLNIGNNIGNRIYSREFLLSQCDQIRRGDIQVRLGTTTCINVH